MEVPLKITGIAAVLLKKVESEYKVLLLKRDTSVLRNVWCYIGGGIEQGETAWEAALREIEEETAISDLSLYTSNLFDQIYSPGENYIYMAPVFVGYVNEAQEVKLNREHSDYEWFSFEEAYETVTFPGNEEVFQSIEKYFANRTPMDELRIKSIHKY